MNKDFLLDFKNSKFFNYMLNQAEEEVLAVYIGGSNLNRTADEHSDIDLFIIIDGTNIFRENNEYLIYNDHIKVHWNWRTIDKYYSDEVHQLECCGHYMFKNITADDFIYINDKYKQDIENLLNDKYIISQRGCINLVKILRGCIEGICKEGTIIEKYYTKMLYHLSMVYFYLNNLEVDLEYIRELKWIRRQPVRPEYLNKCTEIIYWLKENILDNNNI